MEDKIIINGGTPLCGEIKVQGAKNAVLPILAATIINGKTNTIYNCPKITDVYASFSILKELGCSVEFFGNDAVIDSKNMCCDKINHELMQKMRSSVIFTGAILARCKKAVISMPGGCELGPRPIDLHLKAFKALGVKITEADGCIFCDGTALHSADVCLDFPSVGATENVMLLASVIPGITKIYNAAREPELCDLQDFLNKIGATVTGAGTSVITIKGARLFKEAYHTVMGDRIVAATYLTAAAVTGGSITVTGINPEDLKALLSVYKECNIAVDYGSDYVNVNCGNQITAVPVISTAPHPGFPTDAQALITALFSIANGTTIIEENIFSSRYKHVPELEKMGASIIIKDKVAVISGVKRLHGAAVTACDLRGAAALIVAGLNAKGVTTVTGLSHLDRGYEDFHNNLALLGADIKRITED